MSYSQPDMIRVRAAIERGLKVEFWWTGLPGERGAKVVKVDEHGMRWTLDIEATHWVTQKIAAGLLGVSVVTINKWVREGVFPNKKIRRGVSVIPIREVEKLANSRGLFLRSKQ